MKNENFNIIDWQLVRKRVDGTLSDEEQDRLESWINESPDHRLFVERACRYYEREIPSVDDGKISVAWQRFVQDHPQTSRKIGYRWIWTIAASVLICLGGWFLWQNQVKRIPVTVVENTIQPGRNCAVLLLSDGQKVNLQLQQMGQVLTDNEASIYLDSTTITYESNNVQGDSVYNTIQVPRGGEYNLTLADGTKVWLNSQSTLRFPVAFRGKERRVQLTGEAYFDVTPGQKRFIVETKSMDVRVLGTAFDVNAYEDETIIRTTLVRGKIEILVGGKEACVLEPGQQSILERSTGKVNVLQVNTSLYTQWKDGRFVFRDNTLEDIMRILARWYDMKYEFTNPDLKKQRFYGVINRFEEVEGLLVQFEKTGKVKFEYERNKIVIK